MTVFIERFILAILAALVVIVAVTNPLELSAATRVIVTTVIFIIAGVAAYFASNIIKILRYYSPQTPKSIDSRAFVKINPGLLKKQFNATTAIRANAQLEIYINKWIRVSGRIYQIKDNNDRLFVTFKTRYDRALFMNFPSKWRERLEILNRGHRIVVDGRIGGIDNFGVQLEDCEIVDDDFEAGGIAAVQREPSQHGERDAKAIAVTASPAAPDPSPAARPEVRETEKEERIFVGDGITPEYLLGFFQQHTNVQAKNATKDYVGKWMKVSGQVGNVLSTYSDFAQVTFERQKSSPVEWVDYITVYMYFRESWKDRAIILKRGDTITTIGQIREIEAVDLHLDNCELFR